MAKSTHLRKKVYQSADEVFTRFIPGYVRKATVEHCFGGVGGLSEESGATLGKRIAKEFTELARSDARPRAAADHHAALR